VADRRTTIGASLQLLLGTMTCSIGEDFLDTPRAHRLAWSADLDMRSVDHILNTPGLSDDERIAILGGNAAKLMKIPT